MKKDAPSEEIQAAMQDSLEISPAQVQSITIALDGWVRKNARVPDTDPRLWAIIKLLPAIARSLRLKLTLDGLQVECTKPQYAISLLFLERGARWFSGGNWRDVVLSIVSKQTP